LEFIEIEHKQKWYAEMLVLRNEILRAPLGLILTENEIIDDANDVLLGVINKGKLIACIILKKLSSNSCKFRQMAVNTQFQGTGVGKKLMLFAEKKALVLSAKSIELNARETAFLFYEKQGYSICSDSFIEVGITHYKMKKVL